MLSPFPWTINLCNLTMTCMGDTLARMSWVDMFHLAFYGQSFPIKASSWNRNPIRLSIACSLSGDTEERKREWAPEIHAVSLL